MLVIVPHDGSCHIFHPAYGQRPRANNVRPHILCKIKTQLFQPYKCQSGRPIWAARHLSFHATLLSKFTLPFCCKYSTMVTQSAAHTGAQKAYTAHSTPSGRRHIPRRSTATRLRRPSRCWAAAPAPAGGPDTAKSCPPHKFHGLGELLIFRQANALRVLHGQ